MLSGKIQGLFIDYKNVAKATDKARLTVLKKAGYRAQQIEKELIVVKPLIKRPRYSRNFAIRRQQFQEYIARKKADAAKPGRPPFARRNSYPNLRSVVYALDNRTGAMLVGPIARRKRSSSEPTPGVNEKGGTVTINVKTKKGVRPMKARYPKRSVVGPTMKKLMPEMPQLLANSVVGP